MNRPRFRFSTLILIIVAFQMPLAVLGATKTKTVKVRGAEHDQFYGHVMIVPVAKDWQRTEIHGMGITVEVPSEVERVQLHRSPVHIYKSSLTEGALAVGLYPVFANGDALPAAEIEFRFIDKNGGAQTHGLSISDPVSWQRRYFKVLTLEDGRTLQVSGTLHRYFQVKGETTLFDDMDVDVQRIIESIQPSKEASPASTSLKPTDPAQGE